MTLTVTEHPVSREREEWRKLSAVAVYHDGCRI
jgi:hypothetical protein